jgi:hypothetical protein
MLDPPQSDDIEQTAGRVEQPAADSIAVRTDLPNLPKNRRLLKFGLRSLLAGISLVCVFLAWYIKQPGPPRLDLTSPQSFAQSVRLIRQDLWSENEKKFLGSLFYYWNSAHSHFGGTEDLALFPIVTEESGRFMYNEFDKQIEELNGMSGREIIEFVANKRASVNPAIPSATSGLP